MLVEQARPGILKTSMLAVAEKDITELTPPGHWMSNVFRYDDSTCQYVCMYACKYTHTHTHT